MNMYSSLRHCEFCLSPECRISRWSMCVRGFRGWPRQNRLVSSPPSSSLSPSEDHNSRTGTEHTLTARPSQCAHVHCTSTEFCFSAILFSILQLCVPALVHLEWPRDVQERRGLLPLTDQSDVRKLLLQFLLPYLMLPYGSVLVHTLIRSYTHTLIRSYAHTLIHSYAHTLIQSYAHTVIRSYAHTVMHTFFIYVDHWISSQANCHPRD